ncbi:hypothetical protein CF392_07485 [Tamilnaduibacter salinus]|uniref:Lipoprotein n=1 Tax=Tamilnaduibacter salinus TaxID=1484056 RepID=A0A2A2I4B6_9GAMM|nr:hypothetical protein [Tamilnaduibacter salinus]PAV26124.1 hypothetical protein CF392_07485 [Tamilnaduibacter salinus]
MKQKKLITAIALAGSAALLAGCNGGDDVNVDLGGNGSGGGTAGGGSNNAAAPDNCPSWTTPAVTQGLGVCQIRDDITQDQTLTSDITWQFVGQILVGDGNVELAAPGDASDVTLTIEPGTDIRSDVGGYVVVTRGATLDAAGTESNPITFSSVDEGIDGSGEWGGVVVQGFAQTNQNQANGPINVDAEAGLGFYAGDDDADNSGTIQYVRIAEGGFEIAPGEEINGLTLFAVGHETTIDHVQVHGNQDDGIEFFGGAAQVNNLVLTENLDDSIDWDLGFRGNVQYALVTRVAESGYGMETDNFGDGFDATPRSQPTLGNVTIIGASGADASAKHREGTGGFVHNSIYTGDDACLDVDDQNNEITNGDLLYNEVGFNCTNNTTQDGGEGGQGEFAVELVNASTISNFDPLLDGNYASQAADAQLGATTDIKATAVVDDTSLTNTDYLGAVAPSASAPFWFEGWTLEGTL